MPTASTPRPLWPDAKRRDWRGENLDDVDFGRSSYTGHDFRGASLRCALMAYASFARCRFDGADLRLANIKSRSDLWYRRGMLRDQGAILLSRKQLGLELLGHACERLHDLQALAAALTEKRFHVPNWVEPDSLLAATIAAAREPGPNPIARDLVFETRRRAKLPELAEFAAPYMLARLRRD